MLLPPPPPPSTREIGAFEFDGNDRKLLKLQFAKHDGNRDGRLDRAEFLAAFQGCKTIIPALQGHTDAAAELQFEEAHLGGMVDINGFFKCLDRMHSSAIKAQARKAGGGASTAQGHLRAPSADRSKAMASSSLKGLRKSAGDWFGVSNDAMAESQRAFLMRKTLDRRPKNNDDQEMEYLEDDEMDALLPALAAAGAEDDTVPAALNDPTVPPAKLIYSHDDAMNHYRAYAKAERRAKMGRR